MPHTRKPTPIERAKLVRDGFTMPEDDYALFKELKQRLHGVEREAKKSELLRAGLRALALLDAPSLAAALDRLTPVKTGRPPKDRGASHG